MHRINAQKTPYLPTALIRFSIATAGLLLAPGCATIETHLDPAFEIAPYAGTGHAVHRVRQWWNDYSYDGQVAFAVMDVPLCLIADTLLLPYDLIQEMRRPQDIDTHADDEATE